jgi:hydrogenase maturation protein HypF
MELEALARRAPAQVGYEFGVDETADPVTVDAGPVVAAAAADVLDGTGAAEIAARFQQGVVDLVRAVAGLLRRRTGLDTVTLSGGVFLNAFLTARCARALTADGFEVLRHERVPASDAGIALGQVAVLAHLLAREPITTRPRRSTPPDKEPPCA